ncbi:MAG: ABC transporter substrate-binding protein [Ruminococcus sp.]|nr:ABC transporter substrate-binding protein [Ruminococcus sp.]
MKKILALLLFAVIGLTACSVSETPAVTASETVTVITDREGNPIKVPTEIDRILTLAPSITQTAQSMGFSEMIVGIDSYSEEYLLEPLPSVAIFDLQNPDNESILTLEPDIIFVPGISMVEGANPYQPLIDAGICIAVIPSATSLEGIMLDIEFFAECMGTPEKADVIVEKMKADIAEIKAIGDTIKNKKTVLFEISALPYIYSFGSGTFLDEMITLIGAENVFGDEISWIPVTEEAAIAANPDVILTSIYYIDDPEGEILSRAGWEAVTAIKDRAVHKFESRQTDVPNQYVIEALYEMAKFVYPEEYANVEYKK